VVGGDARLTGFLPPPYWLLESSRTGSVLFGGASHGNRHAPAIRHVAFAVEDIDAVVAGLRARGAELFGELERYENSYRLCYVRGPEGIIIELAEQIG
jgi:catechol 2,3-dioxygenase-like lactoylglutathione lyase family enzyme